jgi:CheY-like chemotaxis protein
MGMEQQSDSLTGKILLVEDDFDLRDALIPILEYEGHQVVGAANGREALDRLRSGAKPSLILLDLMMPVMNGAEFRAEQLRDPALASIPVVVVSADPAARSKAEVMGAVGCIQKPLDIDALLSQVRQRVPERNGALASATPGTKLTPR